MELLSHSPEEPRTSAPGWRNNWARRGGGLYRGSGGGQDRLHPGAGRGLGIPDRITSPTFTIVNEYEGGRLPLFHFDMYRLGSADELLTSAGRTISAGGAYAPWSGARTSPMRWRRTPCGWISAGGPPTRSASLPLRG